MEIIVRLREERAALVARITQIDKMLQQYDEWGKEAQRLLSLTDAVKAEPVGDRSGTAAPGFVPDPDALDQSTLSQTGTIVTRKQSRPSLSGAGRKTPIREFEAAVIDVLRKADQPMNRLALYDALTARGIVIGDGGRDKDLNALSARVYRMAQDPRNRIKGERGQGYRLIASDEFIDADATDEMATGQRNSVDPT